MITDLKYALRMLLKAPGFTVIAVLTLALGIGANSAIFSVVDTVLLRPLAFPNPDQLVMIWGTDAKESNSKETDSFPDFYDYREQSKSFSAMAAYSGAGTVLTGTGEAQELRGVAANGDIFEVMGIKPVLGRAFTAEEAKAGQPYVVVIGHGLWKRAFASDPKIVGRQVNMASRSYTVLGVMPPGWKFPITAETSEFIMPLEPLVADNVPRRGSHFLRLIGRLKPGISAKQAEAEMKPIAARLAQQYPDTNTDRGVLVTPLLEDVVGDVRPALLILLGAVALVLLIACANVANLLLARAAARSREIGIRTALGASRALIVRQLLAESLLLALLGGACGLLLAWWGIDLLGSFGPRDVPRLAEVRINPGVGAFTLGLAVLSTLVFGLVPALQVSRPNVSESLQQGSKGSTGGVHGTRMRAFLVVSQLSLSLLLLAGAGLLIKSFFNLRATNPGFEPSRLLVLDQVVPRSNYSEPGPQRRFFSELLPKLAALPGVEAVGSANPLPFSGNDNGSSFRIASEPERGPGTHPDAAHMMVTPGYFTTMKIPLRAGRNFEERDNENAAHVAIVSEAFVRRFVPNRNPIGERILLDQEQGSDPLEIVGVVGDTKQNEMGAEVIPTFYQPFAQAPGRRVWLTLRVANANLVGLEAAVRRVVHEQDPEVFVGKLTPMEKLIGENLAQPQFNMMLLGIFATVAMLLAAIGIYGVIAYSVAQRTREIGIRMALGAQRTQMLGMVLRQSMTVVLIGIVLGLAAALAATRLLASLLYGVGANDVLTYVAVVLLLSVAALLASYIPARRAMKVDPMIALRYE
ncbi:MAG: ABC transporter permease [Chthoniobacterales bacterium]